MKKFRIYIVALIGIFIFQPELSAESVSIDIPSSSFALESVSGIVEGTVSDILVKETYIGERCVHTIFVLQVSKSWSDNVSIGDTLQIGLYYETVEPRLGQNYLIAFIDYSENLDSLCSGVSLNKGEINELNLPLANPVSIFELSGTSNELVEASSRACRNEQFFLFHDELQNQAAGQTDEYNCNLFVVRYSEILDFLNRVNEFKE